ncbi:MAG: hypothetical protein ACKVOP_05610 [Sphingomonadaceae bacterium]
MGPATGLAPELRHALTVAAGGERILWSGQPRAKRLIALFGIWVFAIPWTVFSLFWEAMALMPWFASTNTPSEIAWTFGIVMPIFGLPFILIGFGMLAVPFIAMARAGKTVHALTDKRLLTISVVRGTTGVTAVPIDRTGPVETKINADGSGSLKVQTGSHIDSDGDRITDKFEINGVDDVVTLDRELRALKRS